MNTNSPPSTPERTGYDKAIFFIGFVALALGTVLIIPFRPEMPTSGLDPSWRYAINQAVSQGLVFGRDLVFTFCPLGSVYTTSYSPRADTIMLVGSALFAIGLRTTMGPRDTFNEISDAPGGAGDLRDQPNLEQAATQSRTELHNRFR